MHHLFTFLWYRDPSRYALSEHLIFGLLWPFSLFFRCLVALRRCLYRRGYLRVTRFPVPVVVVGNITVGGTGKTPLLLALAQAFRQQGWRIGIISRGYGGSVRLPTPVTSTSTAVQVGDEPMLLGQAGEQQGFPVWVGADRVAVAQALLQAHPDTQIILSDDGLQHYALARSLELVVMDRSRGVGNQRCLPAGPLREPVRRLAEASAIVWNGGVPLDTVEGTALATWSSANWSMHLRSASAYRLSDRTQTVALSAWAGKTVHAAAGIGHPQRFFQALSACGLEVIPHPFPDHHVFQAADLDFGDDPSNRLPVLLTEKDAVKCQSFSHLPLWVVPAEVELEEGLVDWLIAQLLPFLH